MGSEENLGDEENFEETHDLVMPFVTVASRGGPHDDNSYAAGYEMGTLDTFLKECHPATHSQNILTASKPQADLIAMHHGYKAEFTVTMQEEWTWLTLWKVAFVENAANDIE